MFPARDQFFLCALGLALAGGSLAAAEVPADLTCCRKPFTSCYDPCERVGPIRTLFRRVFRRPCPPVAVVPVVSAAPCCPPAAPVVPAAPPVRFGRPIPVNPPIDVPPPTPPAPFTGSSGRPPRLTPPTPPPPVPVRLDRLASGRGEEVPIIRGAAPEERSDVTLIHATRRGERVRVTVGRDGLVSRTLEPGEWLVYTPDADGRLHFRGKVEAHEGRGTRLTLRED